jgi:hypothetical protein
MAEEVVRIRVRAMKVMMAPQRAAAVGGTGSWLIVWGQPRYAGFVIIAASWLGSRVDVLQPTPGRTPR